MIIKTLLVKLGLDAGDYHKGLSDAKEATSGTIGSIVGNLSKVGGAVVLGGLALAAAGVVALGAGLGVAITEAMGAQQVMAQTQAVIRSTGGAAGMTADQVGDLATSLSLQSRFADDSIQTGENLLLTFTNIGGDVFPMATQAMVDMAAAMGTDVSSGAIQLGKALNDPVAGISALSRVGVTFTEDQKKVITALVATGDVAGAQKIILAELNKEFGGSAAAAAATFGGQMDVLKNRLLNVAEGIGLQLLPVLTTLFDQVIVPAIPIIETIGGAFADFLATVATGEDPVGAVANLLYSVANALGLDGAGIFGAVVSLRPQFEAFVAFMPTVVEAFQSVWSWLQENEGVFIGILAALGVSVGLFVFTVVIPAAIAAIGALLPIILPLIAIAAAVAFLYEAWQNNWGGIRDTLTAFWTTTGQPLLAQIQAWLGVVIPAALQLLSDFWTGTLLPAIQTFVTWYLANIVPMFVQMWTWLGANLPAAITVLKSFWETVLLPAIQTVAAWVTGTLLPLLGQLRDWLQVTIPAAISTLKGFWENTLLPAIKAVWAFIQDPLMPLFQAIVTLFNVGLTLALTALAGLWEKVLQPALKVVVDFIVEHLQPVFETLVKFWNETLGPALTTLKDGVLAQLPGVFAGIRDAIQWVIDKIGTFTSYLGNIHLPWWLTPGSPTPFEMGLRGVAAAMDDLSRRELPSLQARLNLQPVVVGAAGAGGPTTNSRTSHIQINYPREDAGSVSHTLKLLDRLDG